jgi:hypothetical protein
MNSILSLRAHLATIIAKAIISKAQTTSLRTQILVARKLDRREESYEIPYDE